MDVETNHTSTTISTPSQAHLMKKKITNTIFFRFTPSNIPTITRKHFESIFSNIGPVKKCSLIRSSSTKPDSKERMAKGYGFCRYTSQEDAELAAKTLKEHQVTVDGGQKLKIWVELASEDSSSNTVSKDVSHQTGKKLKSKDEYNIKNETRNQIQTSSSSSSALPPGTPSDDTPTSTTSELLDLQTKKRTCRVIIRNLSFYATEYHIKQTLEKRFGPIADINLPLVPTLTSQDDKDDETKSNKKNKQQHRGFAFVTFENPQSAQAAVDKKMNGNKGEEGEILIKNRPVSIEFSVSKFHHDRMIEEEKLNKGNNNKRNTKSKVNDDGNIESKDQETHNDVENQRDDEVDEDEDDDDDDSEVDGDDSDSESTSSDDDEKDESESKSHNFPTHQHSLFLRNLPFDATRHDLFTLFSKYGHIDGIYLVKDKVTGIGKGTAFIQYSDENSCNRALEEGAANTSNSNNADTSISDFQSLKQSSSTSKTTPPSTAQSQNTSGAGFYLNGRRILIDKAVEKSTADSLKIERDEDGKPIGKNIGKDKRNLYLKVEGRVADTAGNGGDVSMNDDDAWDNLPLSDQLKRGRAHQEKHTKLRSPLFFINPYRLSIRNLSKNIDESELKTLIVTGIKKGLEHNLVSKDDAIAHWRASGEMTSRDILNKIVKSENANSGSISEEDEVIPPFDEKKGIKHYIPSVYIDRDFGLVAKNQSMSNKSAKQNAPSRGFGFVEFTHHLHALACLRELNNNSSYSSEYVAGGKKAIEMKRNPPKKLRKKMKNNPNLDDEGKDGNANPKDFLGKDGKVKVPRLIVEFTVENKAKARKQAENRAKQIDNMMKQKHSTKNDDDDDDTEQKVQSKDKTKKSRGALQREKKRKMKESGITDDGLTQNEMNSKRQRRDMDKQKREGGDDEKGKKKVKTVKPEKKKTVDKDEVAFESMVRSYKQAFSGDGISKKATDDSGDKSMNNRSEVVKKRWFEE